MTDTAPATGTETTEATTETTETTETQTTDTDAAALLAEVEKWKTQSRKHEDRAKANASAAKELEQFKQASMSDQEKAVEQARAEARLSTLQEVGSKVVDAEVRAAVAGRNVDADALLEGLDRMKFIGEDGEPDRDAITAWVDRIAPKPEEGFPDLGQGVRNTGSVNTALNGDPLERDLKQKLGLR